MIAKCITSCKQSKTGQTFHSTPLTCTSHQLMRTYLDNLSNNNKQLVNFQSHPNPLNLIINFFTKIADISARARSVLVLTTDMFSFSSDFLLFLVFFLVDSVPSIFFFLDTVFFSDVSDTVSDCEQRQRLVIS